MSENQFMQSYTVAEVSKLIDVPSGTIREWEKQLDSVINIPRDEKGSRYYTELEIQTLRNIKAMRDKKLSMAVIRDLLEQARNLPKDSEQEENLPVQIHSKAVLTQSEAIEVIKKQSEMIQVMATTMNQMVTKINQMESSIEQLQQTQTQIAATQTVHSESLSETVRAVTSASESLVTISEGVRSSHLGITELVEKSRSEVHKKKKFLGIF